jgi:hypothetical protein
MRLSPPAVYSRSDKLISMSVRKRSVSSTYAPLESPAGCRPAEPQGERTAPRRQTPCPASGPQLRADLALTPSDGFSFQARSIVRMSARRLLSATAHRCAIICSFVRPRLDRQCQCHWVGFLIFSSFLRERIRARARHGVAKSQSR